MSKTENVARFDHDRKGCEGDAPVERDMIGFSAWEERFWAEGFPVVAGTDEAGRGPLAGPVVAAAFAVLAHDDPEVRGLLSRVSDSKQMTEEKRNEAFAELTDKRFEGRMVWAIGEASVAEIDETNILRASLLAMSRAVKDLKVLPQCVLVDGCNRPPELLGKGERWTRGSKGDAEAERNQQKLAKWFTAKPKAVEEPPPWRPERVEAVIEGDAKVPSISAASVLAKVRRDQLMEELHRQHPEYGFASHRGYGTEEHLESIRTHGVCPHHRRSFGPVRDALSSLLPASDVSAQLSSSKRSGSTTLCPVATPQRKVGASNHQNMEGASAEGASIPDANQTDNGTPAKRARVGAAKPKRAASMENPGCNGKPRLQKERSTENADVGKPKATGAAKRGPRSTKKEIANHREAATALQEEKTLAKRTRKTTLTKDITA